MRKIILIASLTMSIGCAQDKPERKNKPEPLPIPPIWSKAVYDISGPVRMNRLIMYKDAYETPAGWAPIEKAIILDEFRYFNRDGNIDSIVSTTYDNEGITTTLKLNRTPNPMYGIITFEGKVMAYDTIERINPYKSVTRRYSTDGELTVVDTHFVDSLGRVISRDNSELLTTGHKKKTSLQFEYRNGIRQLKGSTDVVRTLQQDKYNNPLESITIRDDGTFLYTRMSYKYYE